MLKSNQLIEVCWHPVTKQHYVDKGYVFTKMREYFIVKAEDLSEGCHKKVSVICDYCNKEFITEYHLYIRSLETGKACCKKCHLTKAKETNIKRYGVENPFSSEKIQYKIKQSCFEKYGAINPVQTDCIKERIKQTNLIRYGYENPSSSKIIRNKIINNNQQKYGVSNPSKLEKIKNKIKNTNLKKYGVTCSLHNAEISEKVKVTNIQKYGVPYTTQSPEVITKMRESLYQNGNVPTSKAEKETCNILKEIYGADNCIENYPFDRLNFDCLVKVEDKLIDVEYDGWYWHKNKQNYDKRRNYFVIKRGYKVLRIKANMAIPTKVQIIKAIDYLVKGNHSLTEIILDI